MDDAGEKVIDLIFGRWRSQILYTGVKLGVFDALASSPKNAARVASELDVDAGMLYRLMRALGSLELLHEDQQQRFSLTPMGEFLRQDHPHTLRGMTLLEEGPESYATWRHLPALITEGQQNAFVREFGQPVFERAAQNPSYGAVVNEAMSSYSRIHTTLGDFRKRPYSVRVGMRRCSLRHVNPDSLHEVLSCACSTPHGKADRRSLRRKSPISASRHPN